MLFWIVRPDRTTASKSRMSEELTEHEGRLETLEAACGDLYSLASKLEAKVGFLYYLFAASILLAVALTYVNFRAIQDLQDQSHVHPREVPSAER